MTTTGLGRSGFQQNIAGRWENAVENRKTQLRQEVEDRPVLVEFFYDVAIQPPADFPLNRSHAPIGVWGMLCARYRKNGLSAFARMNVIDSSV